MAHLASLQQSSAGGRWRRLPPQLLDGGVLPGYEREAQELHSEQCPKGPALLLLAGLRHRSPARRRAKGSGGARCKPLSGGRPGRRTCGGFARATQS